MFGQRNSDANTSAPAPTSVAPSAASDPFMTPPAASPVDINGPALDALTQQAFTHVPSAPSGTAVADPINPMAPPQPQVIPQPAHTTAPVHMATAPSAPAVPGAAQTTDDLVRMKQEALQHLQPLVGSLQQSPEEEFRTLMMMIQATDDKTLLPKALESAKKISDDKIRAQAMLDVINEINYFTQTAQD